jgi:hypothetical protein
MHLERQDALTPENFRRKRLVFDLVIVPKRRRPATTELSGQ